MTIASALLQGFPELSPAQKEVIGHDEGPLLVVAGPGSGKTACVVLRTLNLLLLEKARPREIILCTFTEKAAYEMRDRLSSAARSVGYKSDLSELRVGTIHGLCNRILSEHLHRTSLGHGYETLDELTQLLFVYECFDKIIGPTQEARYLGRWTTRWTAIRGACRYFDKVTEELLDPQVLTGASESFPRAIGAAYQAYERALVDSNRVDFAHLQKWAHALLADPAVADSVVGDVKYVLVDEYQDTNYVQEQLILELAAKTGNLCVVGDEDQSLYRFRGATVRNILEFPDRLPGVAEKLLTTNYRSHRHIVSAYGHWMASADWSNPAGRPFRYDKAIEPDAGAQHPEYPAVFAIWGATERDEAERFADLVHFLKEHQVIDDYSQVALLLHSVRQEHSGPYLAALERQGIPGFCPRARAYFDHEEIRLMVACLALIFGWHGAGRGELSGALQELADYVDEGIKALAKQLGRAQPLVREVRQCAQSIEGLQDGQSLDMRPADYFYRLLASEPFLAAVRDENVARRLSIISQLLNVFQSYYHYTVVTHANRVALRMQLFNSFLRLLHDGGINDYEDPDRPFPRGYVQVMTIHQAKGLEFPVVVVGSLAERIGSPKEVDRELGGFYHRPPYEPEKRITAFDRMRLHYVAFSRPQKLLVLTSHEQPRPYFAPIWQGLPQWPYVQTSILAAQRFQLREHLPVKRSYSFTGDLKVYETCPRQYQFFREYNFTPSRSAVIFFGLLVHQTIEDVHRIVLDGGLATLGEERLRAVFDRTFHFLSLSDVRPVGATAREAAFAQVLNYFHQNQDQMRRVVQTEVDVSLEKDSYILTGKVDLLMGGDGKLELLDFKTSPRPVHSPELVAAYERQLCTYAHILQQRHGRHVDRMLLYWTAEPNREDALMAFPFHPDRVDEAGRYFDEVVRRIQARDFAVSRTPGPSICKECDLRLLCQPLPA